MVQGLILEVLQLLFSLGLIIYPRCVPAGSGWSDMTETKTEHCY